MKLKILLAILALFLVLGGGLAAGAWSLLPDAKALRGERDLCKLLHLPGSLYREPPRVLYEPVSGLLACVSCWQTRGCRLSHATEVARTLVDPRSTFAVARGAFLVLALRTKYDRAALASLHYALLAAGQGVESIDALCGKLFQKSCDELSAEEAWAIQRGLFAHEGSQWRALDPERLKADAEAIRRDCGQAK